MSQMRQLGITIMMYASDYDDAFVPSTNYDTPTSDPTRIWTVPVFPYVKNKEIFVAPGSATGKYAEDWSTRNQQSVGMNGATAYGSDSGACAAFALIPGCEYYSTVAMMGQMEEPSRVGMFAVTPDGPLGQKYRGYVFGPDNGTTYRPDYTAFTSLELAVPLTADRDLVAELGGTLSPAQMKPIYARYGKTGRDDGITPVIFGDGHAKGYSAKTIKTGASGILWRFR
jgi:hypothetical protein